MSHDIARAIAKIESMDTESAAGMVAHRATAHGIDVQQAKRDVFRQAQQPGSIVFIDGPAADEPEAVVILMVVGGGKLLRVALDRNRCANLIAELAKVLA